MSIDIHALSGAYALGALADDEAAEFEEHLRGCDPCRAEVGEFREVAARLGQAAAEAPPESLRHRVLTQADRVRQDPPAPVAIGRARARRRWIVTSLAAAALVAIAGVVGLQVLQDETDPGVPLAAPAAQVFSADDAESVAVPTTTGGTLKVAVSEGRGEMAVDARELPDPGEGKVYQLWTGHGEEMIDAGVLPPGTTGAAMPLPEPGDTVNVTVEPAGGSEQPTSSPIVTVQPARI